jgi:hypothetical protein
MENRGDDDLPLTGKIPARGARERGSGLTRSSVVPKVAQYCSSGAVPSA